MTRNDSDNSRDGAQLTLPNIDTSFFNREFFREFTGRELVMMLPGVVLMGTGFLIATVVRPLLGFTLGGVGAVVMFVGYYYALTARRTSPWQKFRLAVRYRLLQRTLPWGVTEVAREQLHDLETIYGNGVAEMEDGRLECAIRLQGRNTYGETQEAKNALVRQLSQALDKEVDFRFKFYSTSRREDAEQMAAPYQRRSVALKSRSQQYLRAVLADVATWFREEDAPDWNAARWEHYVVVVVDADEGDVADFEAERETPLETVVRFINPFSKSAAVGGINARREMRRKMRSRIDTITGQVSASVEGLEADRLNADEHACLLLSYWTDERHTPDEELQLAHKRTRTGPSIWPDPLAFDTGAGRAGERDSDPVGSQVAKDRLLGQHPAPMEPQSGQHSAGSRQPHGQHARSDGGVASAPSGPAGRRGSRDRSALGETGRVAGRTTAFDAAHVDVGGGYVQIGEQYCKTFWIEEFPVLPESVCFEELFTTPGLNVDVCLHVEPEHKRSVQQEINNDQRYLAGESAMRAGQGDERAAGLQSEKELHDQFANALQGASESWRLNGYVTVRVGPEKVVDTLTDLSIDEYEFESLDAAMMQGLIGEAAKVRRILTSGPEHLSPKVPQTAQLAAFKSCGPSSRDVFDELTTDRLPTRALGGAIGALFPPCSASIFEEGGIDWGRSQHNALHVRADPFQRGTAPHLITMGVSRSGKTFGSEKAALRWYADQGDEGGEERQRTLICCDTQSGFDGFTKVCDGEHIVVDGSVTINPLDMYPVPERLLEAAGGREDPYRTQIDAIIQFFVGILDSLGVQNPHQFTTTLEEALSHTYEQYGIYPGQPHSLHNESPTVEDLIETLQEMGEHPERFAFGTADWETAPKVEKAARLLDHFSGFRNDDQKTGRYGHFVGESDVNLMDEDVDMIYLDLKQFQNADDAEKAAMLQLMLTLVANKIRTMPGEKLFMIDEAHFLLHSDAMSQWLEGAAREWARYDAALWFISQHPDEFVSLSDSGEDSEKDEILAQCSTMQIYRTPGIPDEVWETLGLNEQMQHKVNESLTPGKAGEGYSECIMNFDDRKGWLPIYVEVSKLEYLMLNYTPRKHGAFDQYLARHRHRLPAGTVEQLPESARIRRQ